MMIFAAVETTIIIKQVSHLKLFHLTCFDRIVTSPGGGVHAMKNLIAKCKLIAVEHGL